MKIVSHIGALLKHTYRVYSNSILDKLEARGFSDLRPSFIEILIYIAEHDGPSLTEICKSCHLKKQTMTGHINELVKRGYLVKKTGEKDKRETRIYFTELGEKFRLNLLAAVSDTEDYISQQVGSVEILRVKDMLESFFNKIV